MHAEVNTQTVTIKAVRLDLSPSEYSMLVNYLAGRPAPNNVRVARAVAASLEAWEQAG